MIINHTQIIIIIMNPESKYRDVHLNTTLSPKSWPVLSYSSLETSRKVPRERVWFSIQLNGNWTKTLCTVWNVCIPNMFHELTAAGIIIRAQKLFVHLDYLKSISPIITPCVTRDNEVSYSLFSQKCWLLSLRQFHTLWC